MMAAAAEGSFEPLKGRVAVITGGATGIGRAIARHLASKGAAVVIAARGLERGQRGAEEINEAGGTAIFVRSDVTSAESIGQMVATAVEQFGSIHILVNNSGIEVDEEPDGPSEADWDRMFATNTKGTWLCCKAALPHLLRSRGVIINNASMAGLIGVAGSTGYAASKAAVVSLTKSLALTYADQGLRVNAICPGPIDTEMMLAEWQAVGGKEEGQRRALAVSPARRIGSSEEIAELVGYLASDAAGLITGAAIPIDGGKTAGLMPIDRYRW
jgi:NAD(P)-dependent dehydrogenase (short-subunit alcohol dehydrogenase family)